MYADTTVNNLQATLPLISTVWSAAGSRPETQRRLEVFCGTDGEIRSKKSICRCTVFTFKKTRISAGKRGRGTLISVFNGAVRRPFNGTAGYEYSGQSHPGGPCADPRKAESGTTQGPDATLDNLYNSSACHAAFNIMKTPSLIQKILNSDLPDGFLWTLPDLRVQTY